MEYTEEKQLVLKFKKDNVGRTHNRWTEKICAHKWISMIIISLIILSSINGIMIYNFFKILQTIWIYIKFEV